MDSDEPPDPKKRIIPDDCMLVIFFGHKHPLIDRNIYKGNDSINCMNQKTLEQRTEMPNGDTFGKVLGSEYNKYRIMAASYQAGCLDLKCLPDLQRNVAKLVAHYPIGQNGMPVQGYDGKPIPEDRVPVWEKFAQSVLNRKFEE